MCLLRGALRCLEMWRLSITTESMCCCFFLIAVNSCHCTLEYFQREPRSLPLIQICPMCWPGYVKKAEITREHLCRHVLYVRYVFYSAQFRHVLNSGLPRNTRDSLQMSSLGSQSIQITQLAMWNDSAMIILLFYIFGKVLSN